jgi:hypothetical protein
MGSVFLTYPAAAQVTGGGAEKPTGPSLVFPGPELQLQTVTVVVMDFTDVSSYGQGILGKQAAAAVRTAMEESGRFEVVSTEELNKALQDLGFSLPLNKDAELALGRKLDAAGIVTGQVRAARIVNTRDGLVGEIQVAVTLRDMSTTELVNGALEIARSTPKPGYAGSEDVLIYEALGLVADKIVRTMLAQRIPQATVLTEREGRVYVRGGSRQGLRPGMRMAVLRFGELAGYIVLDKVDSDSSEGRVTFNLRGITERDKAVAIYTLPETAGYYRYPPAAGGRAPRVLRNMNSLLGILAGCLILATIGGGNKTSAAKYPVGGILATSLANAADNAAAQETGGVLVTWSGPPRGEGINVLAYEIFRDGQLTWVKWPQQGAFFIDGWENALYAGQSMVVTTEVDSATGIPTTLTIATGTGDTLLNPPADNSLIRSWFVYDLEPGIQHRYQVNAIVKKTRLAPTGTTTTGTTGVTPTTTTGTTVTGTTTTQAAPHRERRGQIATIEWIVAETPMGAESIATPIPPVELTSPLQNAAVTDPPSAVPFEWNATTGAHEYVLQISRDLLFRPENSVTLPVLSGIPAAGSEQITTVDVAGSFPGTGAQLLFWRVGARSNLPPEDVNRPRLTPGSAGVRPQDAGFVWSKTQSFTITIPSSQMRLRKIRKN